MIGGAELCDRQGMTVMQHRLGARAALTAALFALVAAPAAVAVDDNEYPVLSNFSATPNSLGPDGGTVTISVDATDDGGVSGVGATVYLFDGGVTGVELEATDPEVPDTYSGTVEIPANNSNEPVSHTIEVSATDTAGETTLELLGSIEVEGQPVFDQAPYVSDPSLDPTNLPSDGGSVTIGVTATDDRSISEVYADVTDPVGEQTRVQLDPISGSRFESAWTAPANLGTDPEPYTVTITALDDIGQPGDVDAGQVTVAGAQPIADLQVSHEELTFGPQARGARSFRTVTLSNADTHTSVAGTLMLRARRFVISDPRGPSFNLQPGETLEVTVRYRSWLPGLHSRWLRVSTEGEMQPDLRVRLAGHTKRRV